MMAVFFILPVLFVAVVIYLFVVFGVLRGNRFVLWLALFGAGLAVIMSGALDVGPLDKVLVNLWALAVVLLPAWWGLRAAGRAWKGE